MKAYKYLAILASAAFLTTACDPIEDESLRDDFAGATPISQAELEAAISITQMANSATAVEGDQYVIVKNSRPDVGGCWHVKKGDLDLKSASDNDTIVCTSNGEWQAYYVGISGNRIIQTDPVTLTVTNVFDEWSTFFTGAADKTDKSAKKVWKFRECEGYVCHNGAYGYWKYYSPEKVNGNAWWGQKTFAQAGDQRMEFDFGSDAIRTYNADGSLKAEGSFSFTHNVADAGVLGELKLSIPIIGSEFNEASIVKDGTYWVLTLDNNYLTVVVPSTYSGGADWGDMVWAAFYETVAE